jgi:hypothetical protein
MTVSKAQELFKGQLCGTDVCKKPEKKIDPNPTSEPKCYPTVGPPHDNPDNDQVIRLCNFNTHEVCASQSSNAVCRSGSADNYAPVRNNVYQTFFEKADNAPEDCNNLFGNGQFIFKFPLSEASISLCTPALDAIIKACPWTGGEVQNVCGTFALQSCPLSHICEKGNPLW